MEVKIVGRKNEKVEFEKIIELPSDLFYDIYLDKSLVYSFLLIHFQIIKDLIEELNKIEIEAEVFNDYVIFKNNKAGAIKSVVVFISKNNNNTTLDNFTYKAVLKNYILKNLYV